jgi:hypothetical protein
MQSAYSYATCCGRIYFGFQKKYVLGGLITLFCDSIRDQCKSLSNDVLPLDFPLILSGYFIYKNIRIKNIRRYYILWSSSDCWYFALGANATNLLATSEYTNFSIRGKSEPLTLMELKTRLHPCLKIILPNIVMV